MEYEGEAMNDEAKVEPLSTQQEDMLRDTLDNGPQGWSPPTRYRLRACLATIDSLRAQLAEAQAERDAARGIVRGMRLNNGDAAAEEEIAQLREENATLKAQLAEAVRLYKILDQEVEGFRAELSEAQTERDEAVRGAEQAVKLLSEAQRKLDALTAAIRDGLNDAITVDPIELLTEERRLTRSENNLLGEEITALQRKLDAMTRLVDKQAEDDGLWFIAVTAPEAYLQQELRRLHACIEGEK